VKKLENVFEYLFCLYVLIFVLDKIIKKLGEGGEGCVFGVIDPDTNEKCAIKQLSIVSAKKSLGKEVDFFFNQKLHHPNIIQYFSFFTDNLYLNIVMEYCGKGNLDDYVKTFANQTLEEDV
jgi:serine/threonine protein kinase